ncbi:MAG: alginate export family protein, partial [Planctomycetota bacterium]
MKRLKGIMIAAAIIVGTSVPALAGDEELKEEVRALRERVQQLEQRLGEGSASSGELEKAVAAYLESKPGMAGLNVSAPNVKGLKFTGQIRFWGQRWNESYRPTDPTGEDVQDIFQLRTSLQADFDIADDLRSRIEIRDARTLGSEPSTTAQLQAAGAGTDLKQGWFQADNFLDSTVDFTAGRQVWSFGDQRVIGALDWATYGRSFDGALATRKFENTTVNMFGARLFEGGGGFVVRGVDNE